MNTDFQKAIRYLVFGGDVPVIENHEALLEDMKRHCLVPLIGLNNGVSSLGFSSDEKAVVSASVFSHIRTFANVSNAHSALYSLLDTIGVKPVVLKGFSAAKYYPDPVFRTTGDIDFLIRGQNTVEEVADFLSENGYEVEDYKHAAYERHIGIKKDGIHFELHRYFSNRKCDYDVVIDDIIDASQPVECELQGSKFCSLPDAENGLVLLEHISHHMCSSGLGFRQIIDWMCYVNSVLTDEFWDSCFRDIAEKTGLLKLAVHATRMCELYFGLPEHEFTREADESICTALAEDIYASGNFGRNHDSVVSRISGFSNSGNVFKRLQAGGLSQWEAARKHRILRHFAWLYQAFRILFIMLRPSNLKKLRAGNNLTHTRDNLYRSLGINSYRGE